MNYKFLSVFPDCLLVSSLSLHALRSVSDVHVSGLPLSFPISVTSIIGVIESRTAYAASRRFSSVIYNLSLLIYLHLFYPYPVETISSPERESELTKSIAAQIPFEQKKIKIKSKGFSDVSEFHSLTVTNLRLLRDPFGFIKNVKELPSPFYIRTLDRHRLV